jgi:Ca2+-binding EF-hand superfamily protein
VELEDGLKKLIPDETSFQIRKWVNLINLNGDSEISKEEFVSALRSFYSIQQINNFGTEYEKLHPAMKKALSEEEIPAEKIISELSNVIEDSGHTKTEIFHRIDINHNGLIDKVELLDGLKGLGVHVGLIAKVLTVFDRDASG